MRSNRLTRLAVVAAVTASALALTGTALASRCTSVGGSFTGTTYYPPPCLSPIGVCFQLTPLGSFLQTDTFTFQTLLNAGDPSDPTKYVYTGVSAISADGGRTLSGEDTGVMHIDPTELAPFATTIAVTVGTRQYRNATGDIVLTGQLDLSTGLSSGTYTGMVCKSADGDD